jgi:flap endonuclease-1
MELPLCAQVIEGLELTPDQFVDLCILCGCDYCGTIKGAHPDGVQLLSE